MLNNAYLSCKFYIRFYYSRLPMLKIFHSNLVVIKAMYQLYGHSCATRIRNVRSVKCLTVFARHLYAKSINKRFCGSTSLTLFKRYLNVIFILFISFINNALFYVLYQKNLRSSHLSVFVRACAYVCVCAFVKIKVALSTLIDTFTFPGF